MYRTIRSSWNPAPTMAWKKHKIIQWLEYKNIVVGRKMVKLELMQEVKEILTTEKYVIDEKAMESNKIVLRLPPYHCELNPIELAWSVVKNNVKQNNTTFKLNDVQTSSTSYSDNVGQFYKKHN